MTGAAQPDPFATLADRVRSQRRARRWTTKELSKRSGIATTTLYRIEKQIHGTQNGTLEKLAEVFGVSVVWLQYGDRK